MADGIPALPADVQKARFLEAMGKLAALLPEAEFAKVTADADRLLEAFERGDVESCMITDTMRAMLTLAFRYVEGQLDLEQFVALALKVRRRRKHMVN